MNTENDQLPEPPEPPELPEISDQRVDEIEAAVFADIARDRSSERMPHAEGARSARARRARRRTWWIAGGAAAGVIIVAAFIAPSVGSIVSPMSGSADSAPQGATSEQFDGGGSAAEPATDESLEVAGAAADGSVGADGSAASSAAEREVIATASATVTVDDVEDAAREVAAAAEAAGGYVESMSVGGDGQVYTDLPADGTSYPTSGAWVTVRVPADELTSVTEGLADIGDVTATQVSRQDVTEQSVDLQARIDAGQASVDRLTALMGEATSVADLIAAETALAQRQADLESLQQQLTYLDSQVAMSTLTVNLVSTPETVSADPAGFGDGVAAGWNGLVATLNGLVVAIGFLLPWLLVIGVIALIVWGILRALRRRRARAAQTSRTSSTAASSDEEAE